MVLRGWGEGKKQCKRAWLSLVIVISKSKMIVYFMNKELTMSAYYLETKILYSKEKLMSLKIVTNM